MLKMRQIIALILIIVWMTIVFMFSNQPGEVSSGTSGRTTQKIIEIISIFKSITPEEEQSIILILEPIIRKIAHYTLYLIGGLLIINFVHTFKIIQWKEILYSIFIGMAYATTDEIHQLFVEGRSSQITDVFIDTLGTATGVLIFLCIIKLYNKILKRG